MEKPVKPSKTVEATNSSTYYFNHTSNKVSLLSFLDWLKDTIPQGAFDVTINIDEDMDDYNNDIVSCNILIQWKHMVKNAQYKNQLKKYEKQLEKWNKGIKKVRKNYGKSNNGSRLSGIR